MINKIGKKEWSILIITILMFTISFTGCFKKTSTNETENLNKNSEDDYYFQESKVSFPEGSDIILDICILTDNSLRISTASQDMKNHAIWDSKDDGQTWEKKVDIKEILSLTGEEIGYIYLDREGSVFCQFFDEIDNIDEMFHATAKYYLINTDDAVKELLIQLNELDEATIEELSHDLDEEENTDVINVMSTCKFISDEKLLISDYGGTGYLIDRNTGQVLTTYSMQKDGMQMVSDMESYGDMMIGASPLGTLFYDLNTGELINKSDMELATAQAMDDLSKSFTYTESFVQKSADGNKFYYSNAAGIYQYIGGSTFEQIVNSRDTSMGISSLYLKSMAVVDETKFFLLMKEMDTNNDRLYRYTRTMGGKNEELTIWALEDSFDLQNMISYYQEANPNIKLNLEIGMTGEDAVTVTDVITNLNTKLLSGKGPDVILLDKMPIQTYIQKGILADLSDIIDSNEFYKNIINSYKTDDKLYAIPSRFAPMVIVGDEGVTEVANDLSSLIEHGKKIREEDPDAYIFPENNFAELNSFIYYISLPLWMDKKNIDENALKKYLNQAKEIYNLCSVPENVTFPTDQSAGFLTVNYYLMAEKGLRISPEFLVDPSYQLSGIEAIKKLLPSIEYTLVNNQLGKFFIPYSTLGVNSQSGSQALAKDFIAFSLSEQIQSQNGGVGDPVNRAALVKTLDTVIELELEFELGDLHLTALTDEEKQKFIDLVESLDTPVLNEGVVMEVVYEQLEEYLFDRITLDQAADTIMQKLSLYLVE